MRKREYRLLVIFARTHCTGATPALGHVCYRLDSGAYAQNSYWHVKCYATTLHCRESWARLVRFSEEPLGFSRRGKAIATRACMESAGAVLHAAGSLGKV